MLPLHLVLRQLARPDLAYSTWKPPPEAIGS
eukprot:COSAG04_NODE_30567_length_262_cov_0.564417_1_plen_30_part_10